MAAVLLLAQLLCPAPLFLQPVGKLLGLFLRGLVICCVQPSRKLPDLLPWMGNVVFKTAEVSRQHLDLCNKSLLFGRRGASDIQRKEE